MADNNAAVIDPEEEERRRREEEMERLMLEQEAAEEAAAAEQEEAAAAQIPVMEAEVPPLQQQQQQQSAARHKRPLLSYRPASFLAFAFLLFYAFRTRRQYYLAAVYLSSSKWAYVVTGNAVLAFAVSVFDFCTNTFLSGLRPQEAEGLTDFFRWNVTETCLALTMFRGELTIATALHFVVLITVKCLHHVTASREQHLRMTEEAFVESASGWPCLRSTHIQLLVFLILLQFLDLAALQYTVSDLMKRGPTVSILFAFEAAIMLVSAWSHILLWHLHVLDSALLFGHEREWRVAQRLLHPWKEYKATLTFAVELQAQAVQFLFYSTFFAIVLTYYGMPINLFREVYMSFAALKERLTAFLKYRGLMASMNRFENATDEELDEVGRTCIICRDEMTTADCKRLPGCAHLFHKSCLREWLVQQQTCPTCRSDIAAMEAQEAARNAAANAATQRGEQEQQDTNAEDGTDPTTGGTENSAQDAQRRQEPNQEDGSDGVETLPRTFDGDIQNESAEAPPATAPPRRGKKSRYQPAPAAKVSALDFGPALYKVVRQNGATVWTGDLIAGPLVASRTIPAGMMVLCLELQRHQLPTGDTTYLLRIPGGWVEENAVAHERNITKNQDGQWA